MSRLAVEGEWWPTVARLRCFRGIDTLTALVLALEVGDFSRFRRPAQLASRLGLVPSLDQSGQSRRQGAITVPPEQHANPSTDWAMCPARLTKKAPYQRGFACTNLRPWLGSGFELFFADFGLVLA